MALRHMYASVYIQLRIMFCIIFINTELVDDSYKWKRFEWSVKSLSCIYIVIIVS